MIFGERESQGHDDLEAIEMLVRSTVHKRGRSVVLEKFLNGDVYRIEKREMGDDTLIPLISSLPPVL